jgi:hypothetical protein
MCHLGAVKSEINFRNHSVSQWHIVGVRVVKHIVIEFVNDLLLFRPPEVSSLEKVESHSVTSVTENS